MTDLDKEAAEFTVREVEPVEEPAMTDLGDVTRETEGTCCGLKEPLGILKFLPGAMSA